MPIHRRPAVFVGLLLLTPGCTSKAPASQAPPVAPSPAAPTPTAQAASTPHESEGKDFAADVRLLYRVAACGQGEGPLPANIDAAVLDEHCGWLVPRIKRYQKDYLVGAEKFIAKLRPPSLPTTLVYPFGGGDLLSALTTYPEATEVTTLSLEHAGDPRRIEEMDKGPVAHSLALFRKSIAGLLCCNDSTSKNLMQMERADIPSQLSFFMVGLAVHGYEPVSLRYFTVQPDGTLHYLGADEIAAAEKRTARRLNLSWVSPNFSEAFSNAELTFRLRGQKDAPLRVHRHIAVNLSDRFMAKDGGVLKHLEAKGQVTAMTKAASYLLWNPAFVKVRDYLLGHMVFMVSDSTGIPPRFAKKAGFVQETYGKFTGPFLKTSKQYGDEFVQLWSGQPYRPLPFRYGYPEATKHWHMLITKKPDLKVEAKTK
jgi:hypothetical protein